MSESEISTDDVVFRQPMENLVRSVWDENKALRSERDRFAGLLAYAEHYAAGYAEKLARQEPVIEAAKAWRAQFSKPADTKPPRMAALIAAVDALETGDERVVSAPLIGADATKIPQLSPGTIVRIPGPDVDYVVDKGLETSGAKATLTFTTVDGLDWDEPRAAVQPTGDSQ